MDRIGSRFSFYLPFSFYFTANMKGKNTPVVHGYDWWNTCAVLQAKVGGKFDEGKKL